MPADRVRACARALRAFPRVNAPAVLLSAGLEASFLMAIAYRFSSLLTRGKGYSLFFLT
jgi:hypothetical protein